MNAKLAQNMRREFEDNTKSEEKLLKGGKTIKEKVDLTFKEIFIKIELFQVRQRINRRGNRSSEEILEKSDFLKGENLKERKVNIVLPDVQISEISEEWRR